MAKDKDIVDAEVIEELSNPDWDFEKKSQKKPRGTRKKDFPAFTVKNKEKILEMATLGVVPEICADYAGVHPTTLARWLERGAMAQERVEEDEEENLEPIELDFAEFYMAFRQRRAMAAANPMATIAKEAQENWKAAVVYLEKTFPGYYGPRQSVEVTGHTTQDIRIDGGGSRGYIDTDKIVKRLSTEDLQELRANIRQQKMLKAGDKQEIDEE